MTKPNTFTDRRTPLRTPAVGAAIGVAVRLLGKEPSLGTGPRSNTDDGTGEDPFKYAGVDGTTLVVELTSDAGIEQVNFIQPNGELWGTHSVAAGAEGVSFEFRGAYSPFDARYFGSSDLTDCDIMTTEAE